MVIGSPCLKLDVPAKSARSDGGGDGGICDGKIETST